MANPPEDNNMSYSRFVPERWHPITKTGACLRSLGLGVGTQKSYHAKRPQLFETLVTTGVTEVTRGFSLAGQPGRMLSFSTIRQQGREGSGCTSYLQQQQF